jgi:carboxymethylenebutenolidase
MTRLTREQLESLWAEHLAGEFTTRDVEATLATMIDSASVNHVPVNTGAKARTSCECSTGMSLFLRADDLVMTPLNRVVGDSQLVDDSACRSRIQRGWIGFCLACLRPIGRSRSIW